MTATDYLTAILCVITAIYSYLTYKMSKSSEDSVESIRAQSEAMFRPYVTVSPYIRPNTNVLYLKIENTGKSTAEDLHLKIDKDFFQFGESTRSDHNLKTKAAFVEPIQSLPPGGKLVFALAQGFVIFAPNADQTKTPQQFTISENYRMGNRIYSENNNINLKPFIGSEGETEPIVEELGKIRKVAEKWK